jgi:ABC-type dipeptide/oligopeptide/nickel transport system permease component
MVQFLVKRFIGLIFVLIGVTFITFIMGYFAPGDAATQILGQHATPAAIAALRHAYGLDLPWYQQYYNFFTHALRFDFGDSYVYHRSVMAILSEGLPISLELGFWALALSVVIGVPLGIVSALRANSWIDTTNMAALLVMYSIPSFVLAPVVQLILIWLDQHVGLGWPATGWGNPWQYSFSDIQFKLFPILVFAAATTAYFARLTRTTMLEVMRQDYVRTARAKGMRERVVIYRHGFRNALIPLVTVIGVQVGFLVTGAFFIEQAFSIPGIASITLNSISNRDFPVVQATVVLLAFAVVVANLLSDIMYTVVDPRIKIA